MQVTGHARNVEGSVRRIDEKRKNQREGRKESKEKEKRQKEAELKRLKSLKSQEVSVAYDGQKLTFLALRIVSLSCISAYLLYDTLQTILYIVARAITSDM